MSNSPLVHRETPPARTDGHPSGHSEPEDPQKGADRGTTPSLTFDDIYDTWFDEVSKWIRAMGGPNADRDDLVQEVFIVVCRRLKDFDGQNLAGWLYQIARRKLRDYRHLRWVKRLVFLDPESTATHVQTDSNPQATLETREKQELLMRLLDGLNEGERAAIVLFEIEGYSGQQIAEIQDIPLNTVWTRIHKARQKLSQRLQAQQLPNRKRGVT